MNWLNDFLNDSKHNLPFEIPKEASDKLNSYVAIFKEKTNELKKSMGEQVKEFGSQLQTQTNPPEIRLHQEKPVGNERVTVNSQISQGSSAEVKNSAASAKVNRVKHEEANDIVVKYKIKIRRTEGEIKLPKGIGAEDMREAILTHSGFSVTTKIDPNGTSGGKGSSALTGFNSYASLFSKF